MINDVVQNVERRLGVRIEQRLGRNAICQ